MFPPVEDQLAIIRRGVEKIVPEEELAQKLEHSRKTCRPLRVKYGIDPTGIDVHLGHTVPLRKMRQFQELGHQAVIIIGNATAMVGDPSGRDQARAKKLTAEDIEANARDYLNQVGKVVDLSKAEVHRNGDWFGAMGLAEILRLCGQVTIAQLLTRDDFAKRYAAATPIFLHECLYPVMQAFDSVCIGADIELGGTEQLYSFMLARDLQKDPSTCALAEQWMNDDVKSRRSAEGALPQQIGVMSPILVGLDGVRRMGKSLGNYIGVSESPYDMMKKFMQLPDSVMQMYYELLTDIPLAEVQQILAGHPQESKFRLGQLVIDEFHQTGTSETAVAQWKREVRDKELPTDIEPYQVPKQYYLLAVDGTMQIGDMLVESKLCPSYSEAVRKLREGAVFVYENGEKKKLMNRSDRVKIENGLVFGMGKKGLRKIESIDVSHS
ncbi:tyrosine--tRNA ligase [bacterium]|nr:tyrosine--tRNA ligase [bacterium]